MYFENKKAILDAIKENDTIILFRHINPDGDCVGSTKGLREILRITYPEKSIYIIDGKVSAYLSFLGAEDPEVSDEVYASALGIVLDSASSDRISNKKFALCKKLIKLDHHIPVDNYGDISWVEENRSSTCEMIVDFYRTFSDELKINSDAAKYLYTGMVTDSGRFRYRDVSGETLRCAATLLDIGVDTDRLFAQLYLDSFENLKFKAKIYEKMQITENGVAYIYIDRAMREDFGVSFESACASISALDSIRGSIVWIAFIETDDPDNYIRVRMRSRFVTISEIAERYHGGGHACASGATVYSLDEMNALLFETDLHVKNYKENNEGWL